MKILAKELAERLALVFEKMADLHLMPYIMYRLVKEPDNDGAPINLDQSKAFNCVEYLYLKQIQVL